MAERGIESTSMDAIAEASGVSKATIYNHWADKEALLLEVMADLHGLHRTAGFRFRQYAQRHGGGAGLSTAESPGEHAGTHHASLDCLLSP